MPTDRSPTTRPSYTTINMNADVLGQTHAGFLIVSSCSVSPNEPRLINSVDFLMMFLAHLAPTILPSPFTGLLEPHLVIGCGSLRLFVSAAANTSLMMAMLVSCL